MKRLGMVNESEISRAFFFYFEPLSMNFTTFSLQVLVESLVVISGSRLRVFTFKPSNYLTGVSLLSKDSSEGLFSSLAPPTLTCYRYDFNWNTSIALSF